MSKFKRVLCVVLALATVVSLFSFGITAQAATTEVAQTSAVYPTSADDFTWDNAAVYFLLTDRFNNGNTANDHSYTRGLNQDGSVANGMNKVATFQGGDFAGITAKIKDGYFDKLGVNAIWVAGFCEQTHGYVVGGDGKQSFPHYSYHGYYALDFTELDKNYGTEAEFKTMIDTAHEHGIRIVLDVVMNHPGYNTIYDMAEYNFGTLSSDWRNVYYNWSSINQSNYHGCIKYTESQGGNRNDWAKWWGTDWIRAGLAGYQEGSGDLQGAVTYLPDFKTESTSSLDIPQVLKTKWNKEGTYNSKVSEINSTFSKYNLGSKTVTNYLVSWLSKWVEEYGVDGFRCDTAKHVDISSWKKLSETCSKALQNWRQANSGKAGANWDEDFWMTGENWGQGVTKNNYYTNGFESMINFSFSGDNQGNNCNGIPNSGSINNTYSDYASKLNNDDSFNVLTYISSHDTGLCRVSDMFYQGSALLLLPGGIQVFYGDETNRPYVDCSIHDHEMRGYMNWDALSSSTSQNSQLLAHWQKVGTFRNNHVAIGAGSHKNLSATSGAAFVRSYTKNNVKDTVVCCIGASSNSNVTITLSGAFADGTTVKNTYDNTTAKVSGGKVTFNSGAHGTILIESTDNTQPTQTNPTVPTQTNPTIPTQTQPIDTKPTEPVPGEYVLLGDADLSSVVNVKDATLIQKHAAKVANLTGKALFAANVNGDADVNVKDATAIQKYCAEITTGYKINTKVIYGGTTPTNPTTPTTVTDPTEPVIKPTVPVGNTIDLSKLDGNVIAMAGTQFSTPYAYFWSDENSTMSTWPGEAMQKAGDFFYIVIPKDATKIIFSDNGGSQTGDLTIPGNYAIYGPTGWAGFISDYFDVTRFPIDGSVNPTTPDPTTQPSGDTGYIYLKNDANWSTVKVHYWSDNSGSVWPGDDMESVGGNLYRFSLGKDSAGNQYQNVVFNNGGGTQTANLTAVAGQAFNNASNNWEPIS